MGTVIDVTATSAAAKLVTSTDDDVERNLRVIRMVSMTRRLATVETIPTTEMATSCRVSLVGVALVLRLEEGKGEEGVDPAAVVVVVVGDESIG